MKLPLIAVLLVSALYLAVYYGIKFRSNLKTFGTLRKPKDKNKMTFTEQVNMAVKNELPRELTKKYNKINRKRKRKGQPELTTLEYMEKFRKETEKMEKNDKYSGIFVIGFVAILIIGIVLNEIRMGGTLSDILILTGILLLVEIPIVIFFGKVSNDGEMRREILDNCDKMGMTVMEYADWLEREGSVEEVKKTGF